MDTENIKTHHCTVMHSRCWGLLSPSQMGRGYLKSSRGVVCGAVGTKLLLRPGDKLKTAHVKTAGRPLIA